MTDWSVAVDLDGVLDEDQVDELVQQHTGASVLINQDRARTTVRMPAQSRSLRAAIDQTIGAVQGLTSLTPVGVQACTREELHERLGIVNLPPLVDQADIGRIAGVSRQRAHQLTQQDGFPAPVPGVPGPVYPEVSVREWLEGRSRKPGRPPAK